MFHHIKTSQLTSEENHLNQESGFYMMGRLLVHKLVPSTTHFLKNDNSNGI